MYVFVYAHRETDTYMHVYIYRYVYSYSHIRTCPLHAYTCVHLCRHTGMYACMHVHVFSCIGECRCVCVCVCVCVFTCTSACACVFVCLCLSVCGYVTVRARLFIFGFCLSDGQITCHQHLEGRERMRKIAAQVKWSATFRPVTVSEALTSQNRTKKPTWQDSSVVRSTLQVYFFGWEPAQRHVEIQRVNMYFSTFASAP